MIGCSPQLHVPSNIRAGTLAGHEESLVVIIKTTYVMENWYCQVNILLAVVTTVTPDPYEP